MKYRSFEANQEINKALDATLKGLDAKRGHNPLELVPLTNVNDNLTLTTTHIWSR